MLIKRSVVDRWDLIIHWQAFVTRVPLRVCKPSELHVHNARSHICFVTGEVEVINGVKTYVTTPTVDYPKDKAILYLPDVFGIELINHQVCHTLSYIDAHSPER